MIAFWLLNVDVDFSLRFVVLIFPIPLRELRSRLFPLCLLLLMLPNHLKAVQVEQPVAGSLRSEETEQLVLSKWMKRLPQNVLLSNLSIPGTHDSGALHNGLSFGFARCQTLTLREQLDSGVRFLDIRCRHQRDRFQIYHGIINQRISFAQVIRVCEEFLDDNPNEILLMSVKEESTSEEITRDFQATFIAEIAPSRDRWCIAEVNPSVGDVRGRIVLVDRVGKLGGLDWNKMNLQDDYQALPEIKKQKIAKHFDAAMGDGSGQWFLNYCSGTVPSRLINPESYATQINPFLLEQIKARQGHRLGVVIMDFPSQEIIEAIVMSNRFLRELSVDVAR